MAAYDLVLAKMKSVGAASLPAKVSATASKKKRKQPEPDAAPAASAAAQQLATEPLTDKPVSKKHKKRMKAKASEAASTETYTERPLQRTVPPKIMVQATTVQEPASAQQPRNRHVGRYHKTAAAKKAGSYSKSDLAAILGVDSFPIAAPVSVIAAAQPSEEQVCTRLLTIEHCTLYAVLYLLLLRCTALPISHLMTTETGAAAVDMHSMLSQTHCHACYQCFASYLVSESPLCHSTSQAVCSFTNTVCYILQESSEDTTFEPQDAAASPSGRSSLTQSWSCMESPDLIQWLCRVTAYMCMSVAILLCCMRVYVQLCFMEKLQVLSVQRELSTLHANGFYQACHGIAKKQTYKQACNRLVI